MNIGVSGASGHLGSATVRELKARLGAKAQIVGISRTPDKIAALGVETRAGDFDKPETLADAFRGLDKLVVIPTSDMVPAARSKQACAGIDKAVLSLTSPNYLAPLITDVRGIILDGIALTMLTSGVVIMNKMAKFEI